MRKSNTQLRAEAYYSGKEQLVKAITTLANHLHAPPPAQRKLPEKIVAHDLSKIRQAHMKVREIADMYGLELPALEI
jgi:hypothetical protein